MNVYCLTSLFSFIQNAIAHIDIKGELTFYIPPIKSNVLNNVRNNKMAIEKEILFKAHVSKNTSATAKEINKNSKEDCVYQFPDRKQMDALLSDMMNQLTKIFVRTSDYISRRHARQQRSGKRFKIIDQKFDSRFFEQAYSQMSSEYRQSINETAGISRISSHDPCHHQAEVKEIWRNLLERSKAILKRAAVRCVSDFLRLKNRADDNRIKEKVGQLLSREIKEVRSNQLKMLCDNFKLCYKDLLH